MYILNVGHVQYDKYAISYKPVNMKQRLQYLNKEHNAYFICFTIVLFPDSPAPRKKMKKCKKCASVLAFRLDNRAANY